MLTRLRLKNWRSIKEETIDFTTPITVFIGANSSGKTNIVDGLYFLQRMIKENSPQSTYFIASRSRIRTLQTPKNDPIEFELTLQIPNDELSINYVLSIETDKRTPHFIEKAFDSGTNVVAEGRDGRGTVAQGIEFQDMSGNLFLPLLAKVGGIRLTDSSTNIARHTSFDTLFTFLNTRCQFIGEFVEPPIKSSRDRKANTFEIERNASNTLEILEFMKDQHREIYKLLQDDIRWLFQHIHDLDLASNKPELELAITEKDYKAPTVSSGTRRLIAMLTAYYALDMRESQLPGLVVIEEPDTALNPGMLQRLVGQLRNYTEREDHPRQFILTTHNPAFLDFFEPEEVRVVERDEQGYSHVNRIPEYIKDIWLDKYALGEVWTTNSFGGLPE